MVRCAAAAYNESQYDEGNEPLDVQDQQRRSSAWWWIAPLKLQRQGRVTTRQSGGA